MLFSIHEILQSFTPLLDWLMDPEYPSLNQINPELLTLAFQHTGLEQKNGSGTSMIRNACIPVHIGPEYTCLINFGTGVAHLELEMRDLLKSRKAAMKHLPTKGTGRFAEYIEVVHFQNGQCHVTFAYADQHNLQMLQVWRLKRKSLLDTGAVRTIQQAMTQEEEEPSPASLSLFGEIDLNHPLATFYDVEIAPCYFCFHYNRDCQCSDVMRGRWKRKQFDPNDNIVGSFQNFYEFSIEKKTRDFRFFQVQQDKSLILLGAVKTERKIQRVNNWDIIMSEFFCPLYNIFPDIRSSERDQYLLSCNRVTAKNINTALATLEERACASAHNDFDNNISVGSLRNSECRSIMEVISIDTPLAAETLLSILFENNKNNRIPKIMGCENEDSVVGSYSDRNSSQNQQTTSTVVENHQPDEAKTFQCDICSATFTRAANLRRHFQRAHNDTQNNLSDNCVCKHCGASFSNNNNLRYHILNYHRDQIGFPCIHCNKLYTSMGNLNKHMLTVHLKVTNHICQLCDRTFFQKYNFKRHMETVHKIMDIDS